MRRAPAVAVASGSHRIRRLSLWRARTQWLGGAGIVVILVSILPMGGRNFFQSEVAGFDTGKTCAGIDEAVRAVAVEVRTAFPGGGFSRHFLPASGWTFDAFRKDQLGGFPKTLSTSQATSFTDENHRKWEDLCS